MPANTSIVKNSSHLNKNTATLLCPAHLVFDDFMATSATHHISSDKEMKCLENAVKKSKPKRRKSKEEEDQKRRNVCGQVECLNCHEMVQVSTHTCYIQSLDKKEDDPKRVFGQKLKNRLKYHVGSLDSVNKYEDPPLLIYADYEAVNVEDGTHSPILICAEREDVKETKVFYGPDCSAEFLNYLDA